MGKLPSILRSLARNVWWCVGIGPFVCISFLLCFVASRVPEIPGVGWCTPLGLLGLVLTGLSVWQWFRPVRPGLGELPRCLLLALPLSYLPTIAARMLAPAFRYAWDAILVPETLAVWCTVYALCVGLVFLARQPAREESSS